MLYDGDKWNLTNKDDLINEILEEKEIIIEEKLEEWVEKGKQYPEIMKKFTRYVEKKEKAHRFKEHHMGLAALHEKQQLPTTPAPRPPQPQPKPNTGRNPPPAPDPRAGAPECGARGGGAQRGGGGARAGA